MSAAPTTVHELLAEARRTLGAGAQLDAELLLQSVLDADRAWLYAHPEQEIAPGPASDFHRLVLTRSSGFPLAYLTGYREFWSLSLRVAATTLIPRPETELLVEAGLRLLAQRNEPRVLDLGTGSGAIAIAVAKERPDARVIGVDLSREAVAVARDNATRHALANVEFQTSDWFAALHGRRFDLILCNPPYVAGDDAALSGGEIRFEPRLALDGGPGGLRALTAIIGAAGRHLESGGSLVLEHGRDQGACVAALLRQAGFADVRTARDLAGLERMSLCAWP